MSPAQKAGTRGRFKKVSTQSLKERSMKTQWHPIRWFCIVLIAGWSLAGDVCADMLFNGRHIHLSNEDNRTFKIGITGTTAGYNFIALIENAKQESISLGKLGYWEIVDDPPAVLRNYDLQLIVKNNYKGKFQIEFKYDQQLRDIRYRIMEGPVQVKLDNNDYYPTLIIDHIAAIPLSGEEGSLRAGSKRFIFYDFNSFDADLRRYYGSVKRLLENRDFSHHFYYYESGNYNSYYFKTYKSSSELDSDKMGLSLEDGTLEYYQKILDNLKSLHGADFADQVIIVSRFGKKYSKDLKKYAIDSGMSTKMIVTLWSYDDIK